MPAGVGLNRFGNPARLEPGERFLELGRKGVTRGEPQITATVRGAYVLGILARQRSKIRTCEGLLAQGGKLLPGLLVRKRGKHDVRGMTFRYALEVRHSALVFATQIRFRYRLDQVFELEFQILHADLFLGTEICLVLVVVFADLLFGNGYPAA